MLDAKLVSRSQFEKATMRKAKSGGTLASHLIATGAVTDKQVVEFLLQHYEAPYCPRERLLIIPEDVTRTVPRELAIELRLLPVKMNEGVLTIAVTDPTRFHAIDEVAFFTGLKIETVLVTETDMRLALKHHYAKQRETKPLDLMAATQWEQTRSISPARPAVANVRSSEKPAVALRPAIKVGPDSRPAPPHKAAAPKDKPQNMERRRTEGEVLTMIHEAASRDQVVSLSLQYLLQFADRAAFFVIRKGAIRGYDISGELTSKSAIQSYWVPLLADSTLRQVVRERRIHLGPLGRTAADGILSAALGGRPSRVLAIPIEMGHRVVGVLFADRLHVKMPPWNRMERLAHVMADNLRRIIVKKSNGTDGYR